MKYFKIFILIVILYSIDCKSNDTTIYKQNLLISGLAQKASWGDPFWADVHSSITKAEVAYASNRSEYNFGDNKGTMRPYVFSNLGVDIPIWSSNFSNNDWGLAMTIPFYIDVWMDFFERSTAPVINTSYRFGLPEISYIDRKSLPFVNNYVIKLTPFKHECAHIGDELLLKREEWELPIKRVNVSYNYSEIQITINDPDNSPEANHAIKFGFLMLHNFNNEWYTVSENEADLEKINSVKTNYEYYFQYQYQSKLSKNNFQWIGSVEFRNRVVYNYPSIGNNFDKLSEYVWGKEREWCYNGFFGIRYNNIENLGLFSKLGIGLRAYRGVNPYGQFRSMVNYDQYGISLIFE
jgi:hypothetical protein